MGIDIVIVLVIAVAAIIIFATELLPIDTTALLVMVSLMLTGLVTPEEGISGFSNTATITILALFIISSGLINTGAVDLMGKRIEAFYRTKEWKMLLATMLMAGFVSAFINTTAVVVVFIPIILRVARVAKISPSKLLMPLSFAAILGGTSTIMGTSTNLLVSAISASHGYGKFSLFEFTPLGLIFFGALLLYMLFIGRYLMPSRKAPEELTQEYQLKDYFTEVLIKEDSPYIGKRIMDSAFFKPAERMVIEIMRQQRNVWLPSKKERLRADDRLLISGNFEDIMSLREVEGVQIITDVDLQDRQLKSENTALVEVLVAPNSFAVGKTVRQINFQQQYDAVPLGLLQEGKYKTKRLSTTKLSVGDTMLLEVRKDYFQNFYASKDFILLQQYDEPQFKTQKRNLAIAIAFLVVILAAFNILPILISALTGALAMLVTQCISPQKAYEMVEWKVILLLAGMIPLGIALENTGASGLLASGFSTLMENTGPPVIIFVLFLITILFTSVISNNATAILLAPIAISIAANLELDPRPLLVTIMFAANTSFFTPIGYQTNMLIYGPGKYRFTDYLKVGGGFTIIMWLLASILIPLMYMNGG